VLHHAAWLGDAELVRALLARGADANARAGVDSDAPLGWAAHGSGHRRSDHVGVAEALVGAGAEVEPRLLDVAGGQLLSWLEARLGTGAAG
jgi:ankyrin repeat protein